jgi:hypothetical protein
LKIYPTLLSGSETHIHVKFIECIPEQAIIP